MGRFRKTLTLFDDYYDMMADAIRMDAYRKAIFNVVKKGDVVVDLGAGLGILSFFAIQAGAGKVYAIEKMDSIDLAKEIAKRNGWDNKIVFIHANSQEVTLPERVDVLISETLGSFALEENTLEFTIDARKRFLKDKGRVIPLRLAVWLVPVENKRAYERMEFWRSLYGIDFTPARDGLTRRMGVVDLAPEDYLARPLVYANIDLIEVEKATVEASLTFPFTRGGILHGFGGWFKAWLTDGIAIETSPESPRTHWRQAFLPMKTPIRVTPEDTITMRLVIGPKGMGGDGTLIHYDFFCTQAVDYSNIGRNDPCPCGSGKKYKRCCGWKTAYS